MASVSCIGGTGKLVSVNEAAAMMGVCRQSVRNYVQSGQLEAVFTPGGHARISLASINRYLGLDDGAEAEVEAGTVLYARVSTSHQRADGNLDRQVDRLVDYCRSEYGLDRDALTIIAEHGSGLKEDRKGFLRLVDLVVSGKVTRVVVEWPDRLARFGTKMFEALCSRLNVELIVTGEGQEQEQQTAEQEMAADIMSLVTVYAARKHGARGGDAVRMEVTEEARSRILALNAAGLNQTAIVEHLQVEGFKCPRQGKAYGIHSVRATIVAAAKVRGIVDVEPERGTLLDRFIDERCERSGECFTKAFHKAYAEYCRANGQPVPSLKGLTYTMQRKGFSLRKHWDGHRMYQGLALA